MFCPRRPLRYFFENRLRGKIVSWEAYGVGRVAVDQKTDPGTVEKASAAWHDALELQKISTLLIQEGDIDVLYARVLEAATDLTSADMASLQDFSSVRGELRLLAHRGFHPEVGGILGNCLC